MDMELSSWKVIEQAKEELQILETHHPGRFDYLKVELKAFILLLQSQQVLINKDMFHFGFDSSLPLPATSSATTRGSTCRKRKKGNQKREEIVEMMDGEPCSKNKSQRIEGQHIRRREKRIDVVLERARACLQKIQELKVSFC